MTTQIIQAEAIEKYYHAHRALSEISLSVGAGEFLALVGPSGCGKTTLLKILAGFEEPTAGALRIDGRDMAGVPPSARPTRMVFQKLALFPHKTIYDNIAFPLKIAGRDKSEIDGKVREMLGLMHLRQDYLRRYPQQLSGGEQQRVALARSMISSPSVLLLDEPLSALDVKLKKSLQAELKRLHRNVGTSFVHVTHDLEEAMMLADRICVMRAGEMLQVGSPTDIYYRPADAFVAGFIGETNLLPATVTRAGAAFRFDCAAVTCADPSVPVEQAVPGLEAGPALLMVRPETILLLKDGDAAADCTVDGTVEEYFVKGATIQYRIRAGQGGQTIVLEIPGTSRIPAEVGQPARLGFRTRDVFLLRNPG